MKIDWKRKLSSRKFWVALIDFVSMLMLGLGATDSTAAKVTAIIMAGGGLIAYIIAEGWTDANSTYQIAETVNVKEEEKHE